MKNAPLIRFRIDFDENSNVGPGKIALLESIQKHGSMSAAGRAMKMSYRRAWLLLESLNQTFTDRVSINSAGGVGGGGVEITPFGVLLIERYRDIEQRFGELSNEYLKDIQARIKPQHRPIARRVPVTKKPQRLATKAKKQKKSV